MRLAVDLILHEDKPGYDLWFKAVIALVPALLIALGLLSSFGVLANEEEEGVSVILLGATAFVFLLYWAILPRRYQILEDRVRIVLGGPFSFAIGFDTIKEVRRASSPGVGGVNLATSRKNRVEVLRSRGMNVAISPARCDLFLEELARVMANWERSHARSIPGR